MGPFIPKKKEEAKPEETVQLIQYVGGQPIRDLGIRARPGEPECPCGCGLRLSVVRSIPDLRWRY